MSTPTATPVSHRPAPLLREVVDLLSSMRFAITLLAVICIASVIGTLLKQNEPFTNYVNQFGPFWAEVYGSIGLYGVYSAGWFLAILGFLVLSTSLCIARNTPKILADFRNWKLQMRAQSLASFHHRAEADLSAPLDLARQRTEALLRQQGWGLRAETREGGTMIAARRGSANKLGYLAAHSAIVLVCLGGLLDGDLIVRAQMAWEGKHAYAGGGMVDKVPAEHVLSPTNPTFRGNLLVTEGTRSGTAILNMPDGVVLQPLPFDVELKKFIVDYYATGMPKLFASEVVIHDRDTGQRTEATIKVNEPAHHRGIAIYQSSFDDGGSGVTVTVHPLSGARSFELKGRIGDRTELTSGDRKLSLEYTGLKVINVENLEGAGPTDPRKVDLVSTIDKHLGSGAKPPDRKTMRNVGPALTYKLRSADGQAHEFHQYMVPVDLDGQSVFLSGVRDTPSESFRYLRMPADANGSLDSWLRLRAALADPAVRAQAAARYAEQAVPGGQAAASTDALRQTAQRALALFAGDERAGPDGPAGGLPALEQFIQTSVPQAERERMADVLLRILNGSLLELANHTRSMAGQGPMPSDEATQRFMTQAVLSLSDAAFYPAPLLITLTGFEHVQASVFQVTRAPGQKLVYLGATLLIIGVFAMLYIRERRLWVWLQPAPAGGTRLLAAMSTTRRTLDTDDEFDQLRVVLSKDAP
ncbi:MAG: cytochrome c biogenesis protein ResB [Aquabacterium sp.]